MKCTESRSTNNVERSSVSQYNYTPYDVSMKCVIIVILLSDLWRSGAGLGHLHDGVLPDGGAHPDSGQLQRGQHAAGQRHRHHLCVLPGLSGGSEGEPLSPADGTTHTSAESS